MTAYIEFQCTLSDSQKDKIKHAFENKEAVTIDINLNGGSDKIGITNRQSEKIRKARNEGKTAARLSLSKTQLQKQGGFLGPLLKAAFSLGKAMAPKLAKNAASGAAYMAGQQAAKKLLDNGIHVEPHMIQAVKKGQGISISGLNKAGDVVKDIISFTQGQLKQLKRGTGQKPIYVKFTKNQKDVVFNEFSNKNDKEGGAIVSTIAALALSLVPTLIGAIKGKGNCNAMQDESSKASSNGIRPLTNIDIEKMIPGVQVYSKDMLPKSGISDGLYVVNLQNYFDGNGTHWVAIFCKDKDLEYFDSFGVGPPKDVIKFFAGRPYLFNTTKIQDNDSSMCGYYCVHYLRERVKGVDPRELISDML